MGSEVNRKWMLCQEHIASLSQHGPRESTLLFSSCKNKPSTLPGNTQRELIEPINDLKINTYLLF